MFTRMNLDDWLVWAVKFGQATCWWLNVPTSNPGAEGFLMKMARDMLGDGNLQPADAMNNLGAIAVDEFATLPSYFRRLLPPP